MELRWSAFFTVVAMFVLSWHLYGYLNSARKMRIRKLYGDGICPVGFWVAKHPRSPANIFHMGFRHEGSIRWQEVTGDALSDMGIRAEVIKNISRSYGVHHFSPVGMFETWLSRKQFLKEFSEKYGESDSKN